MKPKHWIVLLSILLVGSNIYWAYKYMDLGVTLHYMDTELYQTQRLHEQAIVASNLNLIGKHSTAIPELIPKDVFGHKPFEKNGCIYAGQICIQLDANGYITAVK